MRATITPIIKYHVIILQEEKKMRILMSEKNDYLYPCIQLTQQNNINVRSTTEMRVRKR